MKIAFFGSPEAALPSLARLLEAGHEVALTVTQPDRRAGRGRPTAAPPVKVFALNRGLPIAQPGRVRTDAAFLETLRAASPDINVVVAYGQILPAEIISLPRWKSVNVHFSLLPKYRGAAPVAWAILNGEARTGVTIFELNEKMDEGDILSREEVDIRPGETAGALEARLAGVGAGLLVATLAGIERLPRMPQDHRLATTAPRLKKEQGRIDWSRGPEEIGRMIRAFSPWPGAFTFWKGERLIVHSGLMLGETVACGPPGRVTAAGKDGIAVCCAGGQLLIERLQRENRKALTAADFLRGARLSVGEILG